MKRASASPVYPHIRQPPLRSARRLPLGSACGQPSEYSQPGGDDVCGVVLFQLGLPARPAILKGLRPRLHAGASDDLPQCRAEILVGIPTASTGTIGTPQVCCRFLFPRIDGCLGFLFQVKSKDVLRGICINCGGEPRVSCVAVLHRNWRRLWFRAACKTWHIGDHIRNMVKGDHIVPNHGAVTRISSLKFEIPVRVGDTFGNLPRTVCWHEHDGDVFNWCSLIRDDSSGRHHPFVRTSTADQQTGSTKQ